MIISEQDAQQIAQEWIGSWNRHDLDAIMAHYAEKIEFTSPLIAKRLENPSGTIKDRKELRSYFEQGLAAYPDLNFELLQLLIGVNSVTLYYRSVKDLLAAEVMILNSQHQVVKVIVHYSDRSL